MTPWKQRLLGLLAFAIIACVLAYLEAYRMGAERMRERCAAEADRIAKDEEAEFGYARLVAHSIRGLLLVDSK